MKILIGCEESQAVTKAFRALGHEAYSCDVLPCSGGHPEWHFQQDIIEVINGWFDTNEVTINDDFALKFDVWSDCQEYEYKDKNGSVGALIKQIGWNWDLAIFFPPCTHLTVSGAKHFEQKKADGRQQQGIDFFMEMINAPIHKIAVENPIGIMSRVYRKPDQIIQPFFFGDGFSKSTCLWLKNLPPLQHFKQFDLFNTEITHVPVTDVYKEWICKKTGKKKRQAGWYYDALKNAKTKEERSTIRSKTFPGIASAMAEQWGK